MFKKVLLALSLTAFMSWAQDDFDDDDEGFVSAPAAASQEDDDDGFVSASDGAGRADEDFVHRQAERLRGGTNTPTLNAAVTGSATV